MENLKKEFTEFFKTVGKMSGFDDLTATIVAKLFLEPEDVAMEDLAKETGYSLASISNKIRMLGQGGIIQRRSKPGTRKVFLYMEKDLSKILKELLIKKQENQIQFIKSKLPGIINKYKDKAKLDKEKLQLKILEHYYKDVLEFGKIIRELAQKLDRLDKND